MIKELRAKAEAIGADTQCAQEHARDEATANRLLELGISRRRFLSYCAGLASVMALPQSMVPRLAAAATAANKPSVVYMSFQECTGCLESMVNAFAFQGGTTIDNLILNMVSLDYQETLMAAAGDQAEDQLLSATSTSGYILVVDGSIPAQWDSGYFISGARSGVARFRDAAEGAALIIAVGTCASFGGLPKADPNPTGAVSIRDLMLDQSIDKPLINVPGCPPIPEVITGVILTYLASGFTVPALDSLKRPQAFYRRTVHSNCYRREFYEEGPFAMSFDDQNARAGGCLYGLGCKGPVTHNACSTIKWNQGTSFPMMSGHGCIGCAEPDFWDRIDQYGDKGFYLPLDGSGGAFGHSGGQPCSQCHGGGSSSRSVGAESGDDDNERSERSERRSGRRGNDD